MKTPPSASAFTRLALSATIALSFLPGVAGAVTVEPIRGNLGTSVVAPAGLSLAAPLTVTPSLAPLNFAAPVEAVGAITPAVAPLAEMTLVPALDPTESVEISAIAARASFDGAAAPRSRARAFLRTAAAVTGIAAATYALHKFGVDLSHVGVPAMALGMIAGNTPTGGSSKGNKKVLLDAIEHEAQDGGTLLRTKDLARLGEELGYAADTTHALTVQLVHDGNLMRLTGGGYIYTSLVYQSRSKSTTKALAAVNHLNSGEASVRTAAQTFTFLSQALAALPEGADIELRTELESLYRNAAAELMREIVQYRLEKPFPSDQSEANARAAAGALDQLFYDGSKPTKHLDFAQMEKVSFLLVEAKSLDLPESEEWMRELTVHLREGMLPGSDDRARPAMLRPLASTTGRPSATVHQMPERKAAATTSTAMVVVPAAKPELTALDEKKFEEILKVGRDITMDAAAGKVETLIGREGEIEEVIKILTQRRKSNPILLGDPGVGKSTIVAGLAAKIARGEVPELKGRHIIELTVSGLSAGMKYRGDLEERIKKIVAEASEANGQVILFIDEIDQLFSSNEASFNPGGMMLQALGKNQMPTIGATTLDKFAKRVEKIPDLLRRFSKVLVEHPSQVEAEKIVLGLVPEYEKHHGVEIPAEVAIAAAHLAGKHVRDNSLPDSAIEALDKAAADVAFRNHRAATPVERPTVTIADVAGRIALMTRKPIDHVVPDEQMLALIRRIPEEMKARIIGQDHAIDEVAEEVQNDMLHMRDRSASSAYMFLGPTGVGKTETVRAIAAVTRRKFLRIDMSEFMEKHSISKLIGTTAGYIGYEEAGILTEPVRQFPDHVILLDEVEKAHPEVFTLLLQILDHGMIRDGQGRQIDFKNVSIYMTSNLGSGKKKSNSIGFVDNNGSAAESEREQTLAAVEGLMRPELIGRISKERMIVFNHLTEADLEKIVELPLNDLRRENLAPRGMTLTVTPAARKAILTHSFKNREFGARPLRQIIFRAMSRAITRAMLAGTVKDGDPVIVDWDAAAQVFVASRAP